MHRSGLSDVVESQRVNALVGWLLVAVMLALMAADLVDGAFLSAGFTLVVAVLALIPAVAYRGPQAMLPWEVLALASFPILSRVLVTGETVGGVTLTGRLSTYLAVAAIALIIAVELDLFTPVRMNYTFAVFFVSITTMATAGVWAVVQWLSDVFLGTALLLDGRPEHVIEEALMWDFVAATVSGLLAGVLFEYYFRRRARAAARIPVEVAREEGERS